MNPITNTVLAAAVLACTAIIIAGVAIPQSAPIEYYDKPDSISPTKVRAGEQVSITRHYTVYRQTQILLTRRMRLGDCKSACSIIDMPASALFAAIGENTSTRGITIPIIATPGIWHLEFQAEWEDFIGRNRTTVVPTLQIEIIK